MRIEKCPHCGAKAMFADDHCSRCRRHRTTGAQLSVEEMRPLVSRARRLASMRTEHSTQNRHYMRNLNALVTTCFIVAGLLLVEATLREDLAAGIWCLGIFLAGILLRFQIAVKVVAALVMLAGVWQVFGTIAGLIGVAWTGVIISVPFIFFRIAVRGALIVLGFRVLIFDPAKNAPPPPVPLVDAQVRQDKV